MEDFTLLNENEIASISLFKKELNTYYAPIQEKYVRRKLFGIFPYGSKIIRIEEHFKSTCVLWDTFITKEEIMKDGCLTLQSCPLMVFNKAYIEIKCKHSKIIKIRFETDKLAYEYLESLKSQIKNINLIKVS